MSDDNMPLYAIPDDLEEVRCRLLSLGMDLFPQNKLPLIYPGGGFVVLVEGRNVCAVELRHKINRLSLSVFIPKYVTLTHVVQEECEAKSIDHAITLVRAAIEHDEKRR